MIVLVVLGDADDIVDYLMRNVCRQDHLCHPFTDDECRLHKNRRAVAVLYGVSAGLGEWGMHEELDTIMVKIKLRAERPGIADEVASRLGINVAVDKKLVQLLGSTEYADAFTCDKAMASLGAQRAGLALDAFLQNGGGGNPHRINFDAIFALVLLGMLQVEDFLCSGTMISV